jgi:hypothetical protein
MANAKGSKKPRPASAAAKSAGAKSGAGKAAPPSPIDTTLAVQAAAALVARRIAPQPTPAESPSGGQRESAAFKQLKEGLDASADQSIGKMLEKTGNPSAKRPSHLPFNQAGRQVGHNQTFGADVNRAGVPRRTGG